MSNETHGRGEAAKVVCHACNKPVANGTTRDRNPLYILILRDQHGHAEGFMVWCAECGPDAEVRINGLKIRPRRIDSRTSRRVRNEAWWLYFWLTGG